MTSNYLDPGNFDLKLTLEPAVFKIVWFSDHKSLIRFKQHRFHTLFFCTLCKKLVIEF